MAQVTFKLALEMPNGNLATLTLAEEWLPEAIGSDGLSFEDGRVRMGELAEALAEWVEWTRDHLQGEEELAILT